MQAKPANLVWSVISFLLFSYTAGLLPLRFADVVVLAVAPRTTRRRRACHFDRRTRGMALRRRRQGSSYPYPHRRPRRSRRRSL